MWFVSVVEGDKLEGYKGVDYGVEVKVDGDGVGEKSVRMVIGWVSKEVYVEVKGKLGGECCDDVFVDGGYGG